MQRITRVMIVTNPMVPLVKEYHELLEAELANAGIEIVTVPRKTDDFIVLGGDGTMLGAIHDYQRFGKPFLGVNFGHKGFFMNSNVSDVASIDTLASFLVAERFRICSFPFLELGVRTTDGRLFRDLAANDVYVKPERSAGSCKIHIIVNGKPYAEEVMGDGVIISTALGSTAYNLSAGGSAVRAGLEVMCLTPINVHTPVQIKPTVWGADDTVEIEVLEPDTRTAIAVCDGREYLGARHVSVKQSSKRFQLVLLEGEEDFTERLVSKIMKVK